MKKLILIPLLFLSFCHASNAPETVEEDQEVLKNIL